MFGGWWSNVCYIMRWWRHQPVGYIMIHRSEYLAHKALITISRPGMQQSKLLLLLIFLYWYFGSHCIHKRISNVFRLTSNKNIVHLIYFLSFYFCIVGYWNTGQKSLLPYKQTHARFDLIFFGTLTSCDSPFESVIRFQFDYKFGWVIFFRSSANVVCGEFSSIVLVDVLLQTLYVYVCCVFLYYILL